MRLSQIPKQNHSTQCLTITSSTNRIPCLTYQRRQKPHNQSPENPSRLPAEQYYREADVPCKARVCTISKDIHFICIRNQVTVRIKGTTQPIGSHFLWKAESPGFVTEHLRVYFLLLITRSNISKDSYLLAGNHRHFQCHLTFQILVWDCVCFEQKVYVRFQSCTKAGLT